MIRSQTVFAGYYKDEQATREVLGEDGWLRSGDVGSIDEDGFITITDRKKDILITAGGKNVAPANLENALKTAPLVSQALVLGDRLPYVAALITVDPAVADGLAAGGGRAPRAGGRRRRERRASRASSRSSASASSRATSPPTRTK